jgi:putative Ca2+/H+ antiporter (TMEM165/GDT1 family)
MFITRATYAPGASASGVARRSTTASSTSASSAVLSKTPSRTIVVRAAARAPSPVVADVASQKVTPHASPVAPRAPWSRTAASAAAALGVAASALVAPEHARAAADLAAAAASDADQSGFVQGLLLILFSEIGDKTFFIAVLLALQQEKKAVFAGTFGALAAMTLISVGLGQVLHLAEEASPFNTDVPWDDYLAVALLLFFGVQTIRSAEDAKAEEEEEDAKEAVAEMGSSFADSSALILSTFALVFAAEWGDKSFFATIALSAAADPVQVVGGALAGHFVATAGAVALGDVIGDYISERLVAYVGGSLFILFAVSTLVDTVSK